MKSNITLVTGGLGFIGYNYCKNVTKCSDNDLIIVDNLNCITKLERLAELNPIDFINSSEPVKNIPFDRVDKVVHLGACSDTTQQDIKYLYNNNFLYTRELIEVCQTNNIPLVYASSASVYGNGSHGYLETGMEFKPLNGYALSKWLCDQYVLKNLHRFNSTVIGLRFFNVYGPHENHKGRMASVIYHFTNQILKHRECKLFESEHGSGPGSQTRDWVYVTDVVDVINLSLLQSKSAICNVGTGTCVTFNQVADAVIRNVEDNYSIKGKITYIKFPDDLRGKYQDKTIANLTNLKRLNCAVDFKDISKGVSDYFSNYHFK